MVVIYNGSASIKNIYCEFELAETAIFRNKEHNIFCNPVARRSVAFSKHESAC